MTDDPPIAAEAAVLKHFELGVGDNECIRSGCGVRFSMCQSLICPNVDKRWPLLEYPNGTVFMSGFMPKIFFTSGGSLITPLYRKSIA